jgi:hypothetical protein
VKIDENKQLSINEIKVSENGRKNHSLLLYNLDLFIKTKNMLNFDINLEAQNSPNKIDNRIAEALLANAKDTPLYAIETEKVFEKRQKKYKANFTSKVNETTPLGNRNTLARQHHIDRIRSDSILEKKQENDKVSKENSANINRMQHNFSLNIKRRTNNQGETMDEGNVENLNTLTNTIDNRNEIIETDENTLKEFPTATGDKVAKVSKSFKILSREEMAKKFEIRKPKTILILLEPQQVKYAQNNDMGKFKTMHTNGKLESNSGAPYGFTLIAHKLFLYPATDHDHDLIFTNKNWPLKKNSIFSLENKGNTIILRGISCVEINDHPAIYKDLTCMGIKNWRPLVGDDPNYGSCKAECEARGNLVDIMHKWFTDGKKFQLKNGHTASLRFDPDIKNPIQCYKCLRLPSEDRPGHYADKCIHEARCGKCGGKKHVEDLEDCKNDSKCVNCPNNSRNNHGSLDKKCPTYLALKEEQIRAEVYNITQKLYTRLPRSRKEQYSEVVKRNAVGVSMNHDLQKWEKTAENLFSNYDRKFETKNKEWDDHFEDIKNKGDTIADSMRQILDETKKGFREVRSIVEEVVENRISAVHNRLDESEKRSHILEKDIIRIDENVETLGNGILRLYNENGKAHEEVSRRVTSLETLMEEFKRTMRDNGVEGSFLNDN